MQSISIRLICHECSWRTHRPTTNRSIGYWINLLTRRNFCWRSKELKLSTSSQISWLTKSHTNAITNAPREMNPAAESRVRPMLCPRVKQTTPWSRSSCVQLTTLDMVVTRGRTSKMDANINVVDQPWVRLGDQAVTWINRCEGRAQNPYYCALLPLNRNQAKVAGVRVWTQWTGSWPWPDPRFGSWKGQGQRGSQIVWFTVQRYGIYSDLVWTCSTQFWTYNMLPFVANKY